VTGVHQFCGEIFFDARGGWYVEREKRVLLKTGLQIQFAKRPSPFCRRDWLASGLPDGSEVSSSGPRRGD